METIKGTFEKSIFFNAEKGISAFWLKPKEPTGKENENGFIKVMGKFCLRQPGLPLFLSGEWKKTDYGDEFELTDICETVIGEEETERLISCLEVPISFRHMKRILRITGPDIFSAAMVPNIEFELYEKTKVDPVALTDLFSKIRKLTREQQLFRFLTKYNGTYDHCVKILKKHPENAMDILLTNPYQLLESAKLPFNLVDQIALDNGIETLSDARIQAILYWCIRKEVNSGNSYVTTEVLCKTVHKLYGEIPVSSILAALNDHPYIIKDSEHPDVYYEASMLRDEKLAAKEFARIMKTRKQLPYHEEFISDIEAERGFPFGSQQRSAFQLLQTTGFKLLTGDPGTGKTTTVNGLLLYLDRLWKEHYDRKPDIALCAPSGRAAQRMKETTNRNALTIHKLIEYQPYGEGEYFKGPDDPIEADVIVVDEVSMLGLSTFSKLISAIKSGSLVILVGDTNQLQSVEPGNVLSDIINSGYVDSCHLTEVFRQGAESLIHVNALKVINGDPDLKTGPDFNLIQCTPENIQVTMMSVVQEMIQECQNPNLVQVLSPMRKGSCGIREGNLQIQGIINPGKGGVWYGYRNYRLNDRVLMMSNNYKLNYFNGDVGYIRKIRDDSMSIEIGDEHILFPREQYGDMDLAYVCTIHKSQGSEYDYLVITLQNEANGMLDRNLLYTAITRGKKKVVILYEGETIKKAIQTTRMDCRRSLLVERILKEMQ